MTTVYRVIFLVGVMPKEGLAGPHKDHDKVLKVHLRYIRGLEPVHVLMSTHLAVEILFIAFE